MATTPPPAPFSCYEVLRDWYAMGKVMREATRQELVSVPCTIRAIKSIISSAFPGPALRAQQERILEKLLYQMKPRSPTKTVAPEASEEKVLAAGGEHPVLIAADQDPASQTGLEEAAGGGETYLLDTAFTAEYSSLKNHGLLKDSPAFEIELEKYLTTLGMSTDRCLTQYELTLALQDALPNVNHQERQSEYTKILDWASSQDHEATGNEQFAINFADYLRSLYLNITADRVDFEEKEAIRNAASASTDGVITMGSLSILYSEGDRVKTTSPQLVKKVKLDPECALGHKTFMAAEEALARNHISSTWEDVIGMYDKAASSAQLTRHHFVAGSAFLRCADCKAALGDLVGQATYLASAGGAYRKDPNYLADAAECLLMAATCASSSSRRSYEAKYLRSAAEVLAENREFERSVEIARKATAVFKDSKLMQCARGTLWTAVECAIVEMGDLACTIELLEELFEISEVARQPKVLFRSAICHLLSLPAEFSQDFSDAYNEVSKTWDEYTDVCPGLLRCSEGALVKSLLEAVFNTDTEKIEQEVGKYLTGHEPEEWVVDILHQIHTNAEEKRAKADKMFRIEKSGSFVATGLGSRRSLLSSMSGVSKSSNEVKVGE